MDIISRKRPAKVLIVDDEQDIRQILYQWLSNENYECVTARDGLDALQKIKNERYALVLCDFHMPGLTGLELLHLARKASPTTAFIIMTAFLDLELATKVLKLGAFDCISKPFNLGQVTIAVQKALDRRSMVIKHWRYRRNLESKIQKRAQELQDAIQSLSENYAMTLEALVTALDAREHETNAHSFRVQQYTIRLARGMGLEGETLTHIARGALLHDIGKIGVPDAILLKPGKLESEEWVEMRKHPKLGYQILQGIHFLEPAAEIVLTHQERFDGKGYPQQLRGYSIPLGARIFAVVDTLDAMTSDRPYRKALPFSVAREEIIRFSNLQFDPEIVDVFLQIPEEEWYTIRESVGDQHTKRLDSGANELAGIGCLK